MLQETVVTVLAKELQSTIESDPQIKTHAGKLKILLLNSKINTFFGSNQLQLMKAWLVRLFQDRKIETTG